MDESMTKIGQRIRELRLRRGFTQKTLAGEQMTRNMLSLIENGVASPSLANIQYIADRLDVPIGYFFAKSVDEEGKYWKMSAIGALRRVFSENQFRECITLILSLPVSAVDDEVAWIAAQAYYHSAMHSAASFELKTAQNNLRACLDYLQKTQYADEELRHAALYYRDLLQILSVMGDIPERLCDLHAASIYIPLDMLIYFQAIRAKTTTHHMAAPKETFWRELIRDDYYIRHLQAISAEEVDLHTLSTLLCDPMLPFPMRCRVCNDAEEAANQKGDFKTAYTAARKKLELLELSKK